MFPGRVSVGVASLMFLVLFLDRVLRAKQGMAISIRRLPALDMIDEAIGRATELGKPVHQAMSYASVMGAASSPMILSGIAVMRYVSRKTSRMDTRYIVTVGNAETYSVSEEVVRSTYAEQGKLDAYDPSMVRFLSTAQFAYTAATVGIMNREKVAANIMIGYFAAESLILAETGHSLGAVQIAGTSVMPQIPFFVATCDYVLIGDEVYAVSAYLDKDHATLGTIAAQDIMKVVVGLLLLVGSLAYTFGSDFALKLLKM
jgi:hypothetical protein